MEVVVSAAGSAPVLRLATLSDARSLSRLRWDFSPDEVAVEVQTFDAFTAQFREWLDAALVQNTWAIWLAELDGQIVANMYIHRVPKVPRPGQFRRAYGYVTNVYTVPELRGQRIGARLLARVIEWARAERLEFLLLWPSEASVQFYERAGFTRSADALELALDD